MGLDIGVFIPKERLGSSDDYDDDNDDYDSVHLHKEDNPFGQSDTFESGFYNGNWSSSWRGGSYSGYGQWRNKLALLTGLTSLEVHERINKQVDRNFKISETLNDKYEINIPTGAFYELINFSDCEGYIGPKCSEKLYKDFLEYEKEASEKDEYFYDKYKEWMNGFKEASENKGVVHFH